MIPSSEQGGREEDSEELALVRVRPGDADQALHDRLQRAGEGEVRCHAVGIEVQRRQAERENDADVRRHHPRQPKQGGRVGPRTEDTSIDDQQDERQQAVNQRDEVRSLEDARYRTDREDDQGDLPGPALLLSQLGGKEDLDQADAQRDDMPGDAEPARPDAALELDELGMKSGDLGEGEDQPAKHRHPADELGALAFGAEPRGERRLVHRLLRARQHGHRAIRRNPRAGTCGGAPS